MSHEALFADISNRKHPRYIFKRRGVLIADDSILPIRTLDVSVQGLGVVATDPVDIGKSCAITVQAVVGDSIVRLDFSGTAVYCILAGVDGFRIGLFIDDKIDLHKKQLKRIIDSCSARVI